MQQQLVEQGLDLMLYGMGTVFVFLAVLVVATVCMSKIVQRFLPLEVKPIETRSSTAPAMVTDEKLLAIIKAALEQHRNR